MSTNTNLKDLLINADIVLDTTKIMGITLGSKYIAKTKIGKREGGFAKDKESSKLPDGIYWIESSNELLYLVNGQKATVPSKIQDNVLNLKNERVQAFSPLKVVNSLSYLRSKGWIESEARPDLNSSCPSKDDEQFFNFEIKQFQNGVEFEEGRGANRFIINNSTSDSYRGLDFKSFILYANIIKNGKIELADMYARDGSLTRLYVNGFKVMEFKNSYITKLANSKDYDRYKDKKNPFLLRNKNKMYTGAEEDKFYFPNSMTKTANGFEYVMTEATESKYYCTFSEESEDKFEISFLQDKSEKIRSALVSHFNSKQMYNHELWHNDVVYSAITASTNPYFLKLYNWRTVAFTPHSEVFFSDIANQILSSTNSKSFEDIHKRYFTVSDDYTSDKFIEYPLKDFVYYCEDNLPALSTGPKEGDTALFGQKDDSKGLKYKDIFENNSNPYSSHKDDINSGKMTLPSRILPYYENTKFYSKTERKNILYKIRRSSTPSLHFSYPHQVNDNLVKAGIGTGAPSKTLKLANGRYLCGAYIGGGRGSCIWSEASHGDYAAEIKPSNAFLAGSDSVPIWMFALLRAQSENREMSNYTNTSTSSTYRNHKDALFNKADIYQVTAPALAGSGLTSSIAADPFIFSQFNASTNFWSFNPTPVQMSDGLYYSFDPYTSIGLNTKSIYLYKDFLKTVCPNLLLVNLLDTQYFAKPSTGPFTNGLFLNGKRVSRKSFFSQSPHIANDIPMLSMNTYSIKNGVGFAYSYRAFFVYDDEGNASLAHDLVAWNGYFSHGLRVHKPNSKNIKTELEKIMESSNSLSDVKTKIKELQTNNKIHRLAISSSSDSILPTGRVPNNASQYIDIELNDWEMSKTTLAEFKNGAPQDPVEKAKVINSAIVNKDRPSDVVVATKDGKLVSGVSIKGHYMNGKLIDLSDKRYIELLKGAIYEINFVDYSDPDQKNKVDTLKGKLIAYKLENGSLKPSLAEGDFCVSLRASGQMKMGGRFSQGARVISYNSPEGEAIQDSDSGIIYSILLGVAQPLNGIFINSKGGPFWIDGKQEKPPQLQWNKFTLSQAAADGEPAKYDLESETPFTSVVGPNFTSDDLFMVTSAEGEITSLPVGIYTQIVQTGTMPDIQLSTVEFNVYEENGKKKYSGSSPLPIGTNGGRLPVVTIPSKVAGNKWLVVGAHSQMNFSLGGSYGLIGIVVELDKDGNGFVKYGSEIQIRRLNTKGKEYYAKAQFVDRDGIFKGKNPEGHGVYYVNGHPTPYKNDLSFRGPKSDLRLISLMNKNFLDEKGDGYLSLHFLEGIKYNFPEDNYEYLPSLEILKTNTRYGATMEFSAPSANVYAKEFGPNSKSRKATTRNKWIEAFTLSKILKEDKNVFTPDTKTYDRYSKFVSGIEIVLTVGKENTDAKTGNIIYKKGTVKSVRNNLDKIYLKVSLETADVSIPNMPTKRNELQKFSIIDLAKHEAGVIWDLLPSTSLGFPVIQKQQGRQKFVELYHKDLIHFTFKNGKAVSVCILDKWKQYMSRYKPILIQKRLEDAAGQMDKEIEKILGVYTIENPEIIKNLLKSVIHTDIMYIDVEDVSESYIENILPQEIKGTYAPVKNRTGSLNSKLTIDLFSTLGDDFESFLSRDLDANGNGYSDGIYWVQYVASPLDQSGDGFWDNSFFQKGKPV